MNRKIIPLTFDVMFTEIFNDENNLCIIEEFIAGYFNYKLDDVRGNIKILSRNLKKDNRFDSRKEVDLLLNYKGKKINIEMSNNRSTGVINRNIVYICKVHGTQLETGDINYFKIGDSVQIIFNNFDNQEELRERWYFRNDKGKVLSEKIRIDIISIEKGKNMCYTQDEDINYLIRWCKIFSSDNIDELKKILSSTLSNDTANKLVKKVNKLSGDDKMVELYGNISRREMEYNTGIREAREDGFAQGINQGIEQGIDSSKKEIALSLLENNVSVDIIEKSTGLTKEEILKLKK